LKILHCNSSREWRGGEAQTFALMTGLRELGEVVELAAPASSPLFVKARESGIVTHAIGMKNEADILSMVRLFNVLRRGKFDIAHSHTAHAHGICALATMLNPEVRNVVTRRVAVPVRTGGFSSVKYRLRCDRFIAISQAVKKELIKAGVKSRIVNVVYSGIDLHKYDLLPPADVRKELGLPGDALVAGTVGSLTSEKGHADIIRAARMVVAKAPRVRFVFAGTGDLEPDLRRLCAGLGISENVVFAGFRTDIGNLLRSCDIFIMASHSEGLGTSVLDAMLTGLPVIGSNTGGIPEMVTDNENGFLFPPGDSITLADRIAILAENDRLRREFGMKSREKVKEFDIQSTVSGTLKVYRQLL